MKYIAHVLFLLTLMVPTAGWAEEGSSITGLWLTQKQDVAVELTQCGNAICGHIAWLHADETPYSDIGKPLCKAEVISSFLKDKNEKNVWSGGKVYRVDKGERYSGILKLVESDRLELKAYIGFPALGKIKTLTRVSAKSYPSCNVPEEYYTRKLSNISPAVGDAKIRKSKD